MKYVYTMFGSHVMPGKHCSFSGHALMTVPLHRMSNAFTVVSFGGSQLTSSDENRRFGSGATFTFVTAATDGTPDCVTVMLTAADTELICPSFARNVKLS